MQTFWKYLKENNSNIVIDIKHLQQTLNSVAEKTIDSIHDKEYKIKNFNQSKFFQNIQTYLANYPLLKNLINALQSKNIYYIWDQQKRLREWITKQPYRRDTSNLRDISREIWTYTDSLTQYDSENAEKQVLNMLPELLQKSQQNMQYIKKLIEEAISRIPYWNNSPIIISANPAENEYGPMLEPADDALITLGTSKFSPNFSFFQIDGKIEIEDVLEGGDEDFFHSTEIQADYFNLVNELKKPGSTNRGKILTLYTARPRKDREQFLHSNSLPANLFLTNDYDHAEGLAIDLAGSGEKRDIWKVKIDSRYLTQTLDGPIKYYQITVPNAPARMELL